MKPISKKIITASACLIAGGAILTGIGTLFGGRPGFSFTSNGVTSQASHKNSRVELSKTKIDAFTNADIKIDSYADIHILPSDDDNYYLEYLLDSDYGTPEYDISNHTFTMTQPDKKIGVFLAFNTSMDSFDTYINLYVPEDDDLNSLNVFNDSGDVTIKAINFQDADITVEYGDVALRDNQFDSLILDVDSGDTKIVDSEIGTFVLESEYGDGILKNIKCQKAEITQDSGDLYLDAAEIENLNCYAEYGDITLLLPDILDVYTFDAAAEYGYINLPSDAPRGFYRNADGDYEYYQTEGTDGKVIELQTDSGNITIKKR